MKVTEAYGRLLKDINVMEAYGGLHKSDKMKKLMVGFSKLMQVMEAYGGLPYEWTSSGGLWKASKRMKCNESKEASDRLIQIKNVWRVFPHSSKVEIPSKNDSQHS